MEKMTVREFELEAAAFIPRVWQRRGHVM